MLSLNEATQAHYHYTMAILSIGTWTKCIVRTHAKSSLICSAIYLMPNTIGRFHFAFTTSRRTIISTDDSFLFLLT